MTKINMSDGSNYLFYLIDHANSFYGNKLIKFLFFNKDDEKDIYKILKKDNLKEELKLENEKISNFMIDNKQYVDMYYNLCKAYREVKRKPAYFDRKNLPKEALEDEKFIIERSSHNNI